MTGPTNGVKVAFSAEFEPSAQLGGVVQNALGLLRALAEFDPGDRFLVVTLASHPDWLAAVLGPNMNLAPRQLSMRHHLLRSLKARLPSASRLRRALRRAKRVLQPYRVPESAGFYERMGVDLVHFPMQAYVRTDLPSVYCPHDLQHVHLPKLFDPVVIADRELLYGAGCREATAVAVETEWVKQDIVKHYSVPAEKIFVLPTAAPTSIYEGVAEDDSALRRAGVERPFAFYPAATWPHKNHVRLFQALKELRDWGVKDLDVVCTGSRYEPHWPAVWDTIRKSGLADAAHFLGFVTPAQLLAIYRRAEFVVVPTIFESVSAPIYEAWHQGAAVTCSNVTALPDQVRDAALLFDPFDVDSIAEGMARLHSDPSLRADLVARGTRRLADFDWRRTARAYHALYRKVAGRSLSSEETQLLASNWMLTAGSAS